MQHTIVLLIESIRVNLSKGQDSEKQKQDRLILLIDQSKVLSNWAMKFDVLKSVKEDEPVETPEL